jgi:hypothetical protein
MRIPAASQPIQPRQNALEQRHRTLPDVVRDLTGVTGMAMLKAIVAGERDPVTLATRRDRRCHHGEEPIATAVQGPWRAEPLCA